MPWYDKQCKCWRGVVRPKGRSGKRILKRFDTKEEALQWERRLKALSSEGVHPDMTVNELAARYMAYKVNNRRSPRTQFDYASLLDLHILPKLGDRQVCDLRLQDIETWYEQTLGEIRERTGKPGISTTNKACTLLYGVLKYGVVLGLLDKNPVEGVERIAWKPEEQDCYDLSELGRLLEAAHQPYRAMFALGAMAGLMPSEWLALTWADLDFENAVLSVSHGMTLNRQGRYERGRTKTTYRVRKLPMPPPLVAELESYRRWCETERPGQLRPGNLLFSTKSGLPMGKENVRRDGWRKAVARAKLPHARMNSLRHSYQTIISSTVPEATFERLAGHARGSNVGRRFYVHQTALGARNLVDTAFSSGCVKKCVKIKRNGDV